MLLKLEGVTGAFSRGDISLPTSYLTPKLPFFGIGLRARELKVLVGTLLTGGGALLNGMDTVLRQSTGLPVSIAEDPLLSVALGTGTALENMKNLGQVLDTAY